MEVIRSAKNEKLKEWLKLKTAKGRKQQRAYLLEGLHLIEEAIRAQVTIEAIIVAENKVDELPAAFAVYPYRILSVSLFAQLAQTQTSQGFIAVVCQDDGNKAYRLDGKFLLVDAIQDPGNLGTIIRTADAAGFSAVVIGEGTVDVYNDKVVRSMQGSQFHLPIVQANLKEWIEKFPHPVFASALDTSAKDYNIMQKEEYLAIVVGNEGNGVQPELLELASEKVMIPIVGQAESLNVAVATGILLYATVKS